MDPRYLVAGVLLAAAIAAYFLLLRRDDHKVPGRSLPRKWRRILRKRVRYFRELSDERQEAFGRRVMGFLEDVSVVGADTKVTLTDELLVAASAEIPLFGYPDWRYPNLDTVILHGGNFSHDFDPEATDRNVLGIVGNRELSRTMVLSKSALRKGFARHTDHSVGIHEFTHLLDMSDGATDGTPEHYLDRELVQPWIRLMHREMAAIREGESDIDGYAATNEAEFLAVTTEYFFTRPDDLKSDHPKLYALLASIFHQDPAADGDPVREYVEAHGGKVPEDEVREADER